MPLRLTALLTLLVIFFLTTATVYADLDTTSKYLKVETLSSFVATPNIARANLASSGPCHHVQRYADLLSACYAL